MWRPIGDVGDCPCGGRIAVYIHHEFGSTHERCVDCNPFKKADLALSSSPDKVTPAPWSAPRLPPPPTRRTASYYKTHPDRPCPRGKACVGDGLLPRRRGKPSDYGCDPCLAARAADRIVAKMGCP